MRKRTLSCRGLCIFIAKLAPGLENGHGDGVGQVEAALAGAHRQPDLVARAEAIQPADETLRIVEAELGDEAGLIGAGLVAFEALDGKR